jgi:hypothetical protein
VFYEQESSRVKIDIHTLTIVPNVTICCLQLAILPGSGPERNMAPTERSQAVDRGCLQAPRGLETRLTARQNFASHLQQLQSCCDDLTFVE